MRTMRRMRTLLLVLTLVGSQAAWAADPATAPPPPDPTSAAPPAAAPGAAPVDQAAPAAPAALEAGDTAPPGAVQPLGAPGAPAPGIMTAPDNQSWSSVPPAPRPRPFYKRNWFW